MGPIVDHVGSHIGLGFTEIKINDKDKCKDFYCISICYEDTAANWSARPTQSPRYQILSVVLSSDRAHWETAVTKKSVVFVPLCTLCGKVQSKFIAQKVYK